MGVSDAMAAAAVASAVDVVVVVDCRRMGKRSAADNGVLIGAAGIKAAAVVRRHIKAALGAVWKEVAVREMLLGGPTPGSPLPSGFATNQRNKAGVEKGRMVRAKGGR